MQIFNNPAMVKLLIWTVGLLTFSAVLKALHPIISGKIGELKVAFELSFLRGKGYKIIHDLFIAAREETSQIDHVIISPKGIIAIETKHYLGMVTGGERSGKWTQHLGKRKYPFLNPILQNKGHILSLQEVLSKYPDISFHSIVVFSHKCKLNVKTQTPVVAISQIAKAITSIESSTQLTTETIKQIYEHLLSLNIKGWKARRQHIKNIKSKMKHETQQIKANLCPRCGGNLVERKGKNGCFIGCSNFPKCRYTMKKGA